jgi:hypothetical protein
MLISMIENLGRRLLLVKFENGQHEDVFDDEVAFEKYSADSNAQEAA